MRNIRSVHKINWCNNFNCELKKIFTGEVSAYQIDLVANTSLLYHFPLLAQTILPQTKLPLPKTKK